MEAEREGVGGMRKRERERGVGRMAGREGE